MMLRSWLAGGVAGVVVSLCAASAFADVIPPDVSACDNKTAGASCDTPSGGTCVESTCTSLDYSNLDDAGHPGTKSYACLDCQVVDGGASSGGDGGTTTTGGGGGGCSASGARAAGTFGLALLPLLVLRGFGRRKRAKG